MKFKGNVLRPILLFAMIAVFCSHDLYLKMELYFLQPNQEATLSLYNGTFEKSENTITRDRMLDASFVARGERVPIKPELWKDQDSTITYLTFNTGEEGTYVAGVSTKARNIELAADKFNDYLKHDGILDMLEQRKKNNTLGQDAVESYQKHVKAIYQVGTEKTEDWKTVLGYPIEFVPLSNPYDSYTGDTIQFQLLLDGKPLANQLVYANHIHTDYSLNSEGHSHDHDHEHSHEHEHGNDDHSHDGGHSHEDNHDHSDEDHSHTEGDQLRTDAEGIVTVKLSDDGIYYIRTIHMVEVENDNELTHESKWATLTFEATHKHGSDTHTHDHHDHEDEDGIPTWVFIVGSILAIGVLFLIFRKKG